MPTAAAVAALQTMEKYNALIRGLKNFNNSGMQVQEATAQLQADPNYLTAFTEGERTVLTNFINSINSIIPINQIPSIIS